MELVYVSVKTYLILICVHKKDGLFEKRGESVQNRAEITIIVKQNRGSVL